ncbi:hypothetical protein [Citreimonas salinaria]|uniref:Polysaccharide deacetylase n=1 Tax=Citreimonas salinaria TaxID=321339 RepID=A0A1H3N355_9RHOB|nr:hypothetical protein [Citreimonas salinaria]SDY83391.1 hypothetical protein SAMN05444340_1206 [Citreimonas salinaria]
MIGFKRIMARPHPTRLSSGRSLSIGCFGTRFARQIGFFLSICFTVPALAQPVNRDVLALYDSREEESVANSHIHRFAEFPLNHLGLRVSYRDVAAGMPDWSEVRADFIVSWFREPVAEPEAFLSWMREAQRRGIPIATIGTSGLPVSGGEVVDDLYAIHGLEERTFVPVTFDASVVVFDRDLVGFECEPDAVLPAFPVLLPTRDDVTTHLAIRARLDGAEMDSSLVTISDAGAFAHAHYALCTLPEIDWIQWLIDPFAFFERAFGLEVRPVPDTTTLSGRRLYFSHIDGDGWNNRSEIPLPWNAQPLSAEIINEHILRAFPEFPVGVGLIGGDVDPDFGASEDAARLAREAFALQNVEVAAHGYTHPFFWWYFEDYDREAELDLINEQIAELQDAPIDVLAGWLRAEQDLLSLPVLLGYDIFLPRAYLERPFSLDEEIDEAIAIANSLAPEGKTAQAFYWTGDTRPFPAAMEATVSAGVRNINGGDSRFDSVYPSMAYLSPLGRQVGAHWQVYTGNANDNTYTDGWMRNYHAMRLVEETVERTGAPRRLKPFNLYYHTFTGERHASLEALVHLHKLAASDEFIHVFPSRYIDTVIGFFSAEITRTDEREWTIRDRGDLQTLRIDRPGALRVDFMASSGVIGQRMVGDALYVSLDPTVESPRLKLSAARRPFPHLVEASWEVTRFTADGCNVALTAEGFGEGQLQIADIGARTVGVVARRDGGVLLDEVLTTRDGRLDIRLPSAVGQMTTLDISCWD